MKKQNKKGFTLAELLIVVAIIAVLTAIAVPLFVGALNKAQNATEAANIRAVRGAAVTEILSKPETYITGKGDAGADATAWKVSATISISGDIKITALTPDTTSTAASDGTVDYDSKSGYTITDMIITELKVGA